MMPDGNRTGQQPPPGYGYPAPYPASEPPRLQFDLGLREILRALARGKWILSGAIVIGMVLVGVAVSTITPLYTSQALILIETNRSEIVPVNEVGPELPRDMESVRNEMFVLSSHTFADRVIRQLDLSGDPEFNPVLRDDADPQEFERLTDAQRRTMIINEFLEKLNVTTEPESRVVTIRFSSRDPDKAADIANALADTYLLSRREAKFESTRTANAWLLERIETLRAEVESGERAIEDLREKYGLLSTGGVTLASQELTELNMQLLRAGSARAEAEARLSQVRRIAGSDGLGTNDQVLNSPLIQRLREQQADVERRIAELSVEYGEKHPRMVQARAEAEDIESAIQAEIDRIVVRLENDVAVARAQEQLLQDTVNRQKDMVAQANQKEIELRGLERDVASNRLLLDTLLARQKETLSQEDFDYQRADARIISEAYVPTEPSYPNKKMLYGLAFLASVFLGLLLILLRELLERGFRSGEEIEEVTGVTSLGFLPHVRGLNGSRKVSQYLLEKPNSAYGEAIRTLNWSINLVVSNPRPKSVLITSSEPREGKTTIAAALATFRKDAGDRVVVVDADIRRPRIHAAFDVPQSPGLLEVLAEQASWEDVVHSSGGRVPDVICAGAGDAHAPNLLDSWAMDNLLDSLCAHYDLVVIDSAPIMAGVDTRVLCGLSEATVFVVRWAETRRPVVKHALRRLEQAGATVAGTVLSGVNPKKYSQYSYGDSGAYTGDLEKYYVG